MANQASNILTARTEFAAALNQVCAERGLEPEVVLETINSAILAAYRKDYGFEENFVYKVEVDASTGESIIKRYPITQEAENVQESEYDETKGEEITPPGFGRIASQTAKQVILQKIREAEKSAIISNYEDKVGNLVSGMILRRDGNFIIVDIGRGQAIMPTEEQVRRERYGLNARMTFFIKDIRDTIKGRQIIVSRSDPKLVEKLFDREVPEVSSGAVEIRAVAREAGERTKIAVFSAQNGVDPVGSCVGQKGVRVQTVINELSGENIDIVEYSDRPEVFIKSALAPADELNVTLDEENKEATVVVAEEQLSLAIGAQGQNVRLAAKLTGYKIDIKGPDGMLTESEKKRIEKEKEESTEENKADDKQEKDKKGEKEVKKESKTQEETKEETEETK
jgi:N utilization substance protein A